MIASNAGVMGGMPGGVPGGVAGGVFGGTGTRPPQSRSRPHPRPSPPARSAYRAVSCRVPSSRRPAPVYPPIAKAAHVSGVVVLHAIIGKNGTIQNLTYVSGPEMLKGAAIDAVSKWRYKPYLLNGDPTEVDTTVTVNFNFGAS